MAVVLEFGGRGGGDLTEAVMSFRFIHIQLCPAEPGIDLLAEFEALNNRHAETHDGHTGAMVCQIYQDTTSPRRFFISGRLLSVEETDAMAKVLGSRPPRLRTGRGVHG